MISLESLSRGPPICGKLTAMISVSSVAEDGLRGAVRPLRRVAWARRGVTSFTLIGRSRFANAACTRSPSFAFRSYTDNASTATSACARVPC
jgi:hypothetical protein